MYSTNTARRAPDILNFRARRYGRRLAVCIFSLDTIIKTALEIDMSLQHTKRNLIKTTLLAAALAGIGNLAAVTMAKIRKAGA